LNIVSFSTLRIWNEAKSLRLLSSVLCDEVDAVGTHFHPQGESCHIFSRWE